MNSKLSTDELFHFTRFERLLNIIKEGFHPRYNLEYTFLSDLFERPAALQTVPMVCFCDIPLEMVQEHSIKYGKSAIGLDKSWGEKFGLSPVIYVHKNSRIGDAISALGNSFSNYNSSMISDGSDIRLFQMITRFSEGLGQLSYYVKQYERIEDEHCYLGSRLCTFKKGRFYDEREWRFVPPNTNDDMWLIDISTLDNEEELKFAHEKLKKHSLKFDMNDIKFIISETEEEQDQLINAIANRFGVSIATVTKNITFRKLTET